MVNNRFSYINRLFAESQRAWGSEDNPSADADTSGYGHSLKEGNALEELLTRDHTLHGAVLYGIDGRKIDIQARAMRINQRGLTWENCARITGMARGAINEVLQRIAGAFSKFKIPAPSVEITIHLAPADIDKSGTWLDLPIAIILLQAAGYLPDLSEEKEEKFILVGEIGLHGELRRVPGVLSLAHLAKEGTVLIVPEGNGLECSLVCKNAESKSVSVRVASSIGDVVAFFNGEKKLDLPFSGKVTFEPLIPKCTDFATVKGQKDAREAALISAAGGHNFLMIGPPGEGKSLIAGAIPGILPPLNHGEMVELTKIYSAAGVLEKDGMAVTRRPMRSIHHTASKESLLGGGSGLARPGEITLAHHGVLFLDELAEFSAKTLDCLRQPIESGKIAISRVNGTLEFPCRFTLVAAMNPCPCGYFGTEKCRCSESDVAKYQKKISGPILDRIDLVVDLKPLSIDDRFSTEAAPSTLDMREIVAKARARQMARFGDSGISCNAAIPGGRIGDYIQFTPQGLDCYKSTVESNSFSTRSMDRMAKVARTVADIEGTEMVDTAHVEKAAKYLLGSAIKKAFQAG